ncbi:hydroxymethylglutaryl-CoA lyase [Chthonomonas calidirosea]|uniref:hydroxymethylglutaryl-CoA lyase n=1 Tax=Chthonomonas calidirosea TaxID=454171 RepID=UPI0006ECB44B|nr:hydroxymethylglutaryl-CoA lyase [Chthonomonas calidirosea]CEK19845.1 hydroxymethylglutaryl-CoA lyase [Chthonomonas calidirosea]
MQDSDFVERVRAVSGHLAKVPRRVRLVEVGPRDGLQNESVVLPTEVKARYISLLSEAGFSEIEITSFVSPKRVPALADAEALCGQLRFSSGVRYTGLVPNRRGLERALAAGVRSVAVLAAASETFSQRNIGMGVKEALEEIRAVCREAQQEGVRVRGYVSTAFYCPYEGRISPLQVRSVVEALLEIGVAEVSLADTIGHAVPTDVVELLEVLAPILPWERVALHFHDTWGLALANVLTGLELGIATFDAASGGAGGCPFAPGAAGNVATEDLLVLLQGMGIETGVVLEKVVEASRYLESHLGKLLPGRYLRAIGS